VSPLAGRIHDSKGGWRLPAGYLEAMVQRAIENLPRDPTLINLIARGWAACSELAARGLLRIGELPPLWQDQRRALGFV